MVTYYGLISAVTSTKFIISEEKHWSDMNAKHVYTWPMFILIDCTVMNINKT